MADFFNVLGSSTVTGTGSRDLFYAFNRSTNFDQVRPDAVVSQLVWNTAILASIGNRYQILAANVQISTDLLVGGDGTDIIYGSNLADAIFYNSGKISGGFGGFSGIEQVWLGDGDDVIDLSAQGAGGIDYAKDMRIYGQAGNDVIIGGAGKDTIEGDSGNDVIFGWRGSDTIFGGMGDDRLYGDDLGFNGIAGDDVVDGGSGNDVIYGGRGSDKLTGGDDDDQLYGQAGGDGLSGGAGNDQLFGDDADTASNDILNGDSGDDQLYGGAGSDELYGGSGDDYLDGGIVGDYMHGGGGNDRIIAGAGNDIIDGSSDSDTLLFTGNRAEYQFALQPDGSHVVTDLRAGSPEGTKTVRNVEFFAFADVTITLGSVNAAPVITSNGGNSSATLAIEENQVAVTIVAATDDDTGQTVSFAISGGADAALFAIDAATGALSFLAPPNFENPADADGDNVYQVIVAANDGNGGSDTQQLSISVLDMPDGSAPVITSNGGGASAAITLQENLTEVTSVSATDADGTSPTYSIAGGADAALFTIDPLTGKLSFLAPPNFENPADQNHDNVYDVVVKASDGSNSDLQTLAISIGNLNDNSPVMTSFGGASTAALSVDENKVLAASVTATDADGTPLVYSITGGVDAGLFTIDAATGKLSFVTAQDYEAPGDSNGDRVYQVMVQASDGQTSASQLLEITLANVNDNAPVITSNGGGTAAALNLAENGRTVATVAANDADGTAPAYAIAGGADAALFTIDPVTGALSFVSAPDFEAPADQNADNVYDVVVQASDGVNSDLQTLAVTVGNLNDNAPVITSFGGAASAAFSVKENGLLAAAITASDADGSPLAYAIAGGADAALFTIDPATGTLSFLIAPDYEAPADSNADRVFEVVVQARDGTANASQALSITISNVNDNAPVITSNGGGASASLSMAENARAVTTVTAADADGTAPGYAIAGGADAALFTIDAVTGALSFVTPPDFENPLDADKDGIYKVTVQASDGANVVDQLLSIAVTDLADTGKTITGSSGNNAINPTTTVLAYQTTALNDTIYGLAGNDIIDGGGGADYMDGGIGNDTFYVDAFTDDGFAGDDDRVIESAGGGTDLVHASVSYRLAAEVENLTLTGSGAINAIGNELANLINGNGAANRLDGGLGDDRLNGLDGADTLDGGDGIDKLYGGADGDTLLGGTGDDLLDGGTGADSMAGGVGNDSYYVDTWLDDGNASNDDQVIELAGEGIADIVYASVNYTLSAQVERLTLTGTAALDGQGNDLGNVITGNSANNGLWGGLGDDSLYGNSGDDRLQGDFGSDLLDGGAGNDWLEGGANSDTLLGKAGNDILIGGTSKDVLTGGTEADVFVFNFGDTSLNSTTYDRITDFNIAEGDQIDLSMLSGSLAQADYAETSIGTNLFTDALAAAKASAGPGHVTFVAGTTDGWVFYDGNGDGAFDQSVMLLGVNSLAGVDYTSFI